MSNEELAAKMIHAAVKDLDFFWANAHPDLVFEFPYAPWIGTPERVAGAEDTKAYIDQLQIMLPGMTFTNVKVMPLAEEGAYLLEYDGACPKLNNYANKYISIFKFKDGKLILFHEYWNTTEITRAIGEGDLAEL
ncbi:nuclear transport factor 2 family protein (plasmid) [Mycolicibacterium psychrotolerans]|uniref:nuclear transport factor 2 family protein n=1 Tax=Mycolicibacterium psychrotolerans TaxID=216929 RepID=UPI003D666796